MSTCSILYFCPEHHLLDSRILHATILSEAKRLVELGAQCTLIASVEKTTGPSPASKLIHDKYGVSVIPLPLAKKSGYWGLRRREKAAVKIVRQASATHSHQLIVCRSFRSTLAAKKISKHTPVCFQVRGLVSEEVALRRGRGIASRLIYHEENKAFCTADSLLAVSENLRKAICQRAGRSDSIVVPSCFDDDRFRFSPIARKEIRSQLGIPQDALVLSYAGGTSKWQKLNELFVLFRGLMTAPNRHVLILSQNSSPIHAMAIKAKIPIARIHIVPCSPEMMPNYLSSADIGFILRDDIPVNNVASPIKIGEYMGCGLAIVMSPGIGGYSNLLADFPGTLVLKNDESLTSQVERFISSQPCDRTKIAQKGREISGWSTHADRLLDFYCEH